MKIRKKIYIFILVLSTAAAAVIMIYKFSDMNESEFQIEYLTDGNLLIWGGTSKDFFYIHENNIYYYFLPSNQVYPISELEKYAAEIKDVLSRKVRISPGEYQKNHISDIKLSYDYQNLFLNIINFNYLDEELKRYYVFLINIDSGSLKNVRIQKQLLQETENYYIELDFDNQGVFREYKYDSSIKEKILPDSLFSLGKDFKLFNGKLFFLKNNGLYSYDYDKDKLDRIFYPIYAYDYQIYDNETLMYLDYDSHLKIYDIKKEREISFEAAIPGKIKSLPIYNEKKTDFLIITEVSGIDQIYLGRYDKKRKD